MPSSASARARFTATVLFPTPPFPDRIMILCRIMPIRSFNCLLSWYSRSSLSPSDPGPAAAFPGWGSMVFRFFMPFISPCETGLENGLSDRDPFSPGIENITTSTGMHSASNSLFRCFRDAFPCRPYRGHFQTLIHAPTFTHQPPLSSTGQGRLPREGFQRSLTQSLFHTDRAPGRRSAKRNFNRQSSSVEMIAIFRCFLCPLFGPVLAYAFVVPTLRRERSRAEKNVPLPASRCGKRRAPHPRFLEQRKLRGRRWLPACAPPPPTLHRR